MNGYIVTLVAVVSIFAEAYALLDWETTQITQKADPTAASVTATFVFENIGDDPVEITEIKSSCGCTTAELEKRRYEPGESGEIAATFNIGSRQGLQTKTIRVTTNEGDQPTVLTMKTLIPKVIEIKPGFVFWSVGEVPAPKTVELKVGLDTPVRIVSAESNNSNVEAHLTEVSEGESYSLDVFPLTTDEAVRAVIILKTDYPSEKPKTFYVHAHVKE